MGTENDTKHSKPSEIEPLEEYNPDQETFEKLDEREMLEPLSEAAPEADEHQDGNETETSVDMEPGEEEIALNDSDEPAGNLPDGDEVEIDLNSGREESAGKEEEPDENGEDVDEIEEEANETAEESDKIEEEADEAGEDVDEIEEEANETAEESDKIEEEPDKSGEESDKIEEEADEAEGESEESGEVTDVTNDTLDTQPEETADPVSEMTGDSDGSSGDDRVDETADDKPVGDDNSTKIVDPSAAKPEKTADQKEGDNDFISLNDDEMDDDAGTKPKEEQPPAKSEAAQESDSLKEDNKKVTEKKDSGQIKKSDGKKLTPLKDTSDNQKNKTPVKGAAKVRKLIAAAAIILIVAGYAVYHSPSVVGPGKEKEPERTVTSETHKTAEPVAVQVQTPKPAGKQQRYRSKLNEVDHLRDKLLAKREEIYRLKLHYRNGISDLQDQIAKEMQNTGISTLDQALNNRRIELNLRTIQRRQNYIQELEKPDLWVHRGSEELLFLKRKAELDLQMVDIASGIDMDRHMRYINSAIQKYQPSAEKLAVDPLPVETNPIEAIWDQIIQKQADIARTPVGSKDKDIISEICSGNFKRMAELTTITPDAARCLSRVNSSELFLNGLTRVSTEDAKYLFQWQGNWICLNGIKELSPAVARHLFRWNGDWISLNGLTEFPPELAVYLMEWKGNQLELMGLKYNKSKPDLKALKYLALWETMGGKLFVSEGVRNEMKRVM